MLVLVQCQPMSHLCFFVLDPRFSEIRCKSEISNVGNTDPRRSLVSSPGRVEELAGVERGRYGKGGSVLSP